MTTVSDVESDLGHHHISKQHDHELLAIRNRVLSLGGLVEAQVEQAVNALLESDVELAERVIKDDYKVNSMEVAIDEECTQILALRQPAARDLRLVVGGGVIRREVLGQLHYYRGCGYLLDYAEESPNHGAVLVRIRQQ